MYVREIISVGQKNVRILPYYVNYFFFLSKLAMGLFVDFVSCGTQWLYQNKLNDVRGILVSIVRSHVRESWNITGLVVL